MEHRQATSEDYQQRINRVLEFINANLGEALSIEQLAEVSNFSPYHFHRIMRAYLNEPLWAYIQRIRLELGARLLQYSDQAIQDIAWKCGFDTPSSFTNAFKTRFGINPTEFRNSAVNQHIVFQNFTHTVNKKIMELKPKIKEVKPRNVIYIQCIEAYGGPKTAEAWRKIWAFVKEEKLFSFGMEAIGLSHDDPNITEADKCRYEACLTIKKEIKPIGEIGVKTIEGGKYAIFKHIGPYQQLGDAYNQIYREWLPGCNYKLREAPCFEKYLNSPNRHKPENLKTNIYIPIQ